MKSIAFKIGQTLCCVHCANRIAKACGTQNLFFAINQPIRVCTKDKCSHCGTDFKDTTIDANALVATLAENIPTVFKAWRLWSKPCATTLNESGRQ